MSRQMSHLRTLSAAAFAAALVTASATAAHATPTKRVIEDPVQPGKAYDIVKVVLTSQPTEDSMAKVVVRHGREVEFGDSIDLWFNIDSDPMPDIHLVGDSFSEYTVFKTVSFDSEDDGKDISNRGCMSLKMSGIRSVVKLDPDCLKAGPKFAVSVKSSRSDKPAGRADYVPASERFTKKVLSGPLA